MQITHPIHAIPAFRWVDLVFEVPRFARLPMMLTSVVLLALVGFLLSPNPYAAAGLVSVYGFALIAIAVWTILARGAEGDLATLNESALVEKITPRPIAIWIETGLAVVIYVILLLTLRRDPLVDIGVSGPAYYAISGILEGLVLYSTLVVVHMAGFLWRQAKLYITMARELSFTLASHQHLQVIANPALRYTFLNALGIAPFVALSQFLPNAIQFMLISKILPPIWIIGVAIALTFTYPIFILRGRIKERKQAELTCVIAALGGNRDALKQSELGEHAAEFKLPDLMYYEDRINNIWEWPIQQHIQKLLFYLLLPPLAWIMAALVERTLDLYL